MASYHKRDRDTVKAARAVTTQAANASRGTDPEAVSIDGFRDQTNASDVGNLPIPANTLASFEANTSVEDGAFRHQDLNSSPAGDPIAFRGAEDLNSFLYKQDEFGSSIYWTSNDVGGVAPDTCSYEFDMDTTNSLTELESDASYSTEDLDALWGDFTDRKALSNNDQQEALLSATAAEDLEISLPKAETVYEETLTDSPSLHLANVLQETPLPVLRKTSCTLLDTEAQSTKPYKPSQHPSIREPEVIQSGSGVGISVHADKPFAQQFGDREFIKHPSAIENTRALNNKLPDFTSMRAVGFLPGIAGPFMTAHDFGQAATHRSLANNFGSCLATSLSFDSSPVDFSSSFIDRQEPEEFDPGLWSCQIPPAPEEVQLRTTARSSVTRSSSWRQQGRLRRPGALSSSDRVQSNQTNQLPALQGNDLANMANRSARTRARVQFSDTHIQLSSYQPLADEPFTLPDGMDSGRNRLAVFDLNDQEPQTRVRILVTGGRQGKDANDKYPPSSEPLPLRISLKDVCKRYPNHVWGRMLRVFLCEGWLAQDIWQCLPDDCRHNTSKARPWNYLQQAIGREIDKMSEEETHVKRIPEKRAPPDKRKRCASDDGNGNSRYGQTQKSATNPAPDRMNMPQNSKTPVMMDSSVFTVGNGDGVYQSGAMAMTQKNLVPDPGWPLERRTPGTHNFDMNFLPLFANLAPSRQQNPIAAQQGMNRTSDAHTKPQNLNMNGSPFAFAQQKPQPMDESSNTSPTPTYPCQMPTPAMYPSDMTWTNPAQVPAFQAHPQSPPSAEQVLMWCEEEKLNQRQLLFEYFSPSVTGYTNADFERLQAQITETWWRRSVRWQAWWREWHNLTRDLDDEAVLNPLILLASWEAHKLRIAGVNESLDLSERAQYRARMVYLKTLQSWTKEWEMELRRHQNHQQQQH